MTLAPELIILCLDKMGDDPALSVKLFQELPEIRVISMNMVNNLVQVDGSYYVLLRDISDFLSLVNGNNFFLHEI